MENEEMKKPEEMILVDGCNNLQHAIGRGRYRSVCRRHKGKSPRAFGSPSNKMENPPRTKCAYGHELDDDGDCIDCEKNESRAV